MRIHRPWTSRPAAAFLAAGALAFLMAGCGGSDGNSGGQNAGSDQGDEWSDLAARGANAPVGSDNANVSSSGDGRFTLESTGNDLPGDEVSGEPVQTDSGLQYFVLAEGDGPTPEAMTDYVKVNYTGYLTDGRTFDSSAGGDPAVFQLNGVVPGFGEGVSTMKVGEKRKLLIPGALGYGPQSRQTPSGVSIPPNAPLIFDVELLGVPDFVNDPAAWPGEEVTTAWTNLQSGVRFAQIKSGSGEEALGAESAAQVQMEAWLTTGDQFIDTNLREDGPTTIYLPTLPAGWAEAMYGMKPGGKRKLVLPAEHAFGPQGDMQLGVPGGATVIADIELMAIDPYVALPANLPGESVTGAPVNLPSGVSYYVLEEGTGEETAVDDSFVSLDMKSWLNDGKEITGQAADELTEQPLNAMFPGIQEALRGMKVGGKRKVILPFDQGPGAPGRAPLIPPKSTMIFDIELKHIDRYADVPEDLPGAAPVGDAVPLESGVKYWVLQAGEGEEVLEESGVEVTMDGFLNDGTEITQDGPMYALRTQMMPGLSDALLGAKVGEKRKIVIPWEQALGAAGSPQGGVPAKASMIVDVEVTGVDVYAAIPDSLPGEPVVGLPTKFESGVVMYEQRPGTGDAMTADLQQVQVKLTTYTTDAQMIGGFSSPQQAVMLPMSMAPTGLVEAMAGMKVGGRRKVVLPWEHAFGLEGNLQVGVLAKMALIIDIELVGIPAQPPPVPVTGNPTPPTDAVDDDGAANAAGDVGGGSDSTNPPPDQSDDNQAGGNGGE